MSKERNWKKFRVFAVVAAVGVTLIVIALALLGRLPLGPSTSLQTTLEIKEKSSHIVAAMRIKLHASAEAEKSAVLAITDQASQEFADQAKRASASVEQDRLELAELIGKGGSPAARDLFNEFNTGWKTFQEIDSVLLPMAVQNTNLKAYDLAFGQAAQAMSQFDEALGSVVDANGATTIAADTIRVSFHALVAAHGIQALQPPHIAESSDQKMDQIEAQMNARNETVIDALSRLKILTAAAGMPSVEAARVAYESFWRTNSDILRLSRENSNVRSLALSLGRKRVVTAQCADVLAALQTTIDTSTFRATR